MQAGYFSTVWHDITASPGWFARLCLLALVLLIPVFGQIVVMGYAFGWARDAAWNLRTPMPAQVFGNEDGRLYSRGLHMFVISFVFGIIPSVLSQAWNLLAGGGVGTVTNMAFGSAASTVVIGMLYTMVIFALSVFCAVFSYVGSIRSAVYCRLSPGFQLKRIWSMIRFDVSGIMRIFLMVLLVTVVSSAVFCGAIIAIVLVMVSGVTMVADPVLVVLLTLADIAVILVLLFALLIVSAFAYIVQARALGYWVAQFDVAAWGGEDDPMPFEMTSGMPLQR